MTKFPSGRLETPLYAGIPDRGVGRRTEFRGQLALTVLWSLPSDSVRCNDARMGFDEVNPKPQTHRQRGHCGSIWSSRQAPRCGSAGADAVSQSPFGRGPGAIPGIGFTASCYDQAARFLSFLRVTVIRRPTLVPPSVFVPEHLLVTFPSRCLQDFVDEDDVIRQPLTGKYLDKKLPSLLARYLGVRLTAHAIHRSPAGDRPERQ